jgi:hypothetical protein
LENTFTDLVVEFNSDKRTVGLLRVIIEEAQPDCSDEAALRLDENFLDFL